MVATMATVLLASVIWILQPSLSADQIMAVYQSQMTLTAEQSHEMYKFLSVFQKFQPALFACGHLGLVSLLLLIFKATLKRNGKLPVGRLGLLHADPLPNFYLWALVIALVASILTGHPLALSLSLITLLPAFFMGLSIVHTLLRKLPAFPLWATIFYLSLIFTQLYVIAIVILLGVIEHWTNLKQRFNRLDAE